jgi:hypothetical protein
MRQGNGTELLGANDPRSASIGIIYVAPDDDRVSVLAAIKTQEKLGRKQVAVVLPEQNKAFQRPQDFDDLKSLRRKLQTQIIFIAAPGPGPAEFARQRRFPVYSSLESYARALRDDEGAGGVGGKGDDGKKEGRLFGSPRSRSANGPASAKNAGARSTAASSAQPAQRAPAPHDEDEEADGPPPVMPFVLGAAAGAGAALAFDRASNGASRTQSASASFGASGAPSPASPASVTPAGEEDWDALPPSSDPFSAPTAPVPAQHANDNAGGPGIIELPVQKKTTVPLAKNGAAPPPDPQVPARSSKRNSGKMVAGAAAAGALGGAALAASANAPTVASGTSVPQAQRPMGNAGGPPPRGNGGGGSGGGGGGGGRGPQRRRTGRLLLLAALVLATLLIVYGSIAYASHGKLDPIHALGGPAPATVTIVPDSKVVSNSYVILGVSGTPDPAQRQVSVRPIINTVSSQPKQVAATGHNQTPGTQATGTLTFYSLASTPLTVAAHTVFTLANGVKIENNVAANIPAASLPTAGFVTVPAHAITTGSAGNIAAFTLNTACCATDIKVQNTQAFTGGQDPKNYMFVQQSDVDGVVNAVKPQLVQQATSGFNGQLHAGEALAGSPQCSSKVGVDQPIGDTGVNVPSVTVSETVTCMGEAYDQKGAQNLVAGLLANEAKSTLGAGYVLAGNVITQISVQNVSKQSVSLLANAKGMWYYQITQAQEQAWAKLIAGKSPAAAQTIIESQTGVSKATIQVNGATLPTDPTQISFVVQSVPGLSGGNGSTPAGSPTVTGSTPVSQPGPGTAVPGNG